MKKTASAMEAEDVALTVLGTFLEAQLPSELPRFYLDGVLIDRRNHTPMEMDAYSLYLGLKALELRDGSDFSANRQALVNAVLNRMNACGGFWSHGAWTGKSNEVHMRFTAAAIRLLVEAFGDGLLASPAIVVDALKKHLSFCEEIEFGTWFLHDSLELPSMLPIHPENPAQNSVWQSSANNNLVLNTHVDTLLTAIQVMRTVPIEEPNRHTLCNLIASGLKALAAVLDARLTAAAEPFAKFDVKARSRLFAAFSGARSVPKAIVKRSFRRVYLPIRKRVQLRYPVFVFPDGYLGRDIGLLGAAFDYHYVNAHDLARLLIQLQEWDEHKDPAFLERCGAVVDNAINYAVQSSYIDYMIASTRYTSRPVLLCELILARLSSMPAGPVPQHWASAYCLVRRSIAPSPALAGYDPFVVSSAKSDRASNGWDIGVLRSGRPFAIHYLEGKFFLDDEAERVARQFGAVGTA